MGDLTSQKLAPVMAAAIGAVAGLLSILAIHDAGVGTSGIYLAVAAFAVVGSTVVWLVSRGGGAERAFAAIYVLASILCVFAFPPFSNPDATAHYVRAWQILDGAPTTVERIDGEYDMIYTSLPAGLLAGLDDHDYSKLKDADVLGGLGNDIDYGSTEEYGVGGTVLYPVVSFLPTMAAVAIGRLVTANALALIYLSRLFNVVLVGIVLYLAIKAMPVTKNLSAVVALSPMVIELCNSNSPDSISIALSMALVSFVLSQRGQESSRMTWQKAVLLILLVAGVGLGKMAYVPLVLLVCLLPVEMFTSKRVRIVFESSIILGVLALDVAWSLSQGSNLVEYQPGVDEHAQVAFMLSNVGGFILICMRTVTTSALEWVNNAAGAHLGWVNVETGGAYVVAYLAMLGGLFLVDNDISRVRIDHRDRLVMGLSSFLVLALVCASLFMQWTAVGASVISGIQGRYFIPIAVPLAIALKPPPRLVANDGLRLSLFWVALFAIVTCMLTAGLIHAL